MTIEERLKNEFSLTENHTQNIISLLDEGCTIPFIARYRKELTGSCDDQTLRNFFDRLSYLRKLDKRKEEVFKLISEQEKMTPEIETAISGATSLTEVEDIYRPFKPKRKTRASVAIAKGLAPLANIILKQQATNLEELAKDYISKEKGVASAEEALTGAKDIVSETISDDAALRKTLRETLFNKGVLKVKLDKKKEGFFTYETYDDFSQEIRKLPSHRILAINRGEKEDFLSVSLEISDEIALKIIEDKFIIKNSAFEELMKEICADSFSRLIFPSIEREVRSELTDTASEQAIKMFKVNLEPLLMQPPLKGKTVLGFDPGYRTGCKIAVVDENGKVLDTGVVYATPPQSKIVESEEIIKKLIKKHGINVIAIGNGTATKESEIFIANLLKKIDEKVEYAIVNEAGASVYSASKLGASEFPQFDVALRSAVSIARRLQDPLAELIKIDVKSIGVGQYQHDMPQARLTQVLDGVVEDCVNSVGVDVNTASPSLLSFIAGLNSGTAKSIVEYREKNGSILNRQALKKVPKLGDKAFEQCAGFLRIVGGENVLDNTAVHPESYAIADALLKYFNLSKTDIEENKLVILPQMVEKAGVAKVAKALNVGEPTLVDIANELSKPGRDCRDELPKPVLKSELLDIADLKEGMVLDGTVRNVIDFGVFVDISVHQDGLVHISQISNEYIKHPSEVLKVGDRVKVKVLSVDQEKRRIALTMKNIEEEK